MYSLNILRRVRYEGLLYIANDIVSHIPSHLFRLYFYRAFMKLTIGNGSSIHMGAQFHTIGKFRLGKNSTINKRCILDNRGGLLIGDNVSISTESCILTADHDLDSPVFEGRVKPVKIEDYVFIGTRAIILPGVILGKGSAVAAGAVVTKDVEPFVIVAGAPAKSIGKRKSELFYIAKYQRLFW